MIPYIIVLGGLIALTYIMYKKRKSEVSEKVVKKRKTIYDVLEDIKHSFAELLRDDDLEDLDNAEWIASTKRKENLARANEECVYNNPQAKTTVKGVIRGFLTEWFPTEESICEIIPFNDFRLDYNYKWEVLYYMLYEKYEKETTRYLLQEYNVRNVKMLDENGKKRPFYKFTYSDFDYAWVCELGIDFKLQYEDMVNVFSSIMYSMYRGLGTIDTLRDSDIDGVNGGVSGSVMAELNNDFTKPRAARSVWVFDRGIRIHFEFLSFNTQREVQRVCQLLGKWNRPGAFTESRGYMICGMEDKSRVCMYRPSTSSYWCFVIRKFTLKNYDLEYLLNPKDIYGNPLYLNTHLPQLIIKFLCRGLVNQIYGGRQGAGKTTGMIGACAEFDSRWSIRTIEMKLEMFLREFLMMRNIIETQTTSTVTDEMLFDAGKKADSDIMVIGEIATNDMCLRAVQSAESASICMMASQHGIDAENVIESMASSYMLATNSTSFAAAQRKVVDAVQVIVHFDFDVDGNKYIDSITEIMPKTEEIIIPEVDPKNPLVSLAEIQRAYALRRTESKCYRTNEILAFDRDNRTYEMKNMFSTKLSKSMEANMSPEDLKDYKNFLLSLSRGGVGN